MYLGARQPSSVFLLVPTKRISYRCSQLSWPHLQTAFLLYRRPLKDAHPEVWVLTQKEKPFPIEKVIAASFAEVLKRTPQFPKQGCQPAGLWAAPRAKGRNLRPRLPSHEKTSPCPDRRLRPVLVSRMFQERRAHGRCRDSESLTSALNVGNKLRSSQITSFTSSVLAYRLSNPPHKTTGHLPKLYLILLL